MKDNQKGSNGQGTVTPPNAPTTEKPNGKAQAVVVKIEEVKTPILPMATETKTVSAIQEKTENLSKLFAKRAKVLAVKKSVDDFKISADKETSAIQLEDANGNTFHSTNPELIREALKVVSARVEAGLCEVDNQILTHAAA